MSNQRGHQLHRGTGAIVGILRPLVGLVVIAIAIVLVVGTWDDTQSATGELPMRIFLVGWMVAAVIISTGFPLATFISRRRQPGSRSMSLSIVYHVAVGVVIGLAIGTTDWTVLRFAGWWQLWWTLPLLLLYASLLLTLRRAARDSL